MPEAALDALGPVLSRWTMGGTAASFAPKAWGEALTGDAGEAELRLLALAGQFLDVLVVSTPADAPRALPDIPQLALPTVPDRVRALLRRVLAAARDKAGRGDLLAFLAARGWTVHPADWMPSAADDEVPDVYAPWRDWADTAAAQTPTGRLTGDGLTADSWDVFGTVARNVAFAALRRRDPDGARALLIEKLGAENADARLRLVGMLGLGLSEADAPFLKSLAADRAPKVKALAATLLARLGHGGAAGDEAAELAGFFDVQTKGFLRRTKVVVPRDFKTHAQYNRRGALFGTVDFAGFAGALGFAPEELVAMWPFGSHAAADQGFVAMAARTASDAVVAAIFDALGRRDDADILAMLILAPRLDAPARESFARQVLRSEGGTFEVALSIAGPGAMHDGIETRAGKALVAALGPAADPMRHANAAGELHALGLLSSRAGAQAALARVAQVGLLAADPRLDMLRLNAMLDDGGTT